MRARIEFMALVACVSMSLSCGSERRIRQVRDLSVDISLPAGRDTPAVDRSGMDTLARFKDPDGLEHTIGMGTLDERTGERLLTVPLEEVRVTARLRNVAERSGVVRITLNMDIPRALMSDDWELYISPRSNVSSLPGLVVMGSNFEERQRRQYEYYEGLRKAIIPESDIARFIDRDGLERYIASHNRVRLREARLSRKGRIRAVSYELRTSRDSAEFVRRFMNRTLVNRNEYLKRELDRRFPRIVTLARRGNVGAVVRATPDSVLTYTYSADIPATEATGRVRVSMSASVRTMDGVAHDVRVSDSLTFIVSTLRGLIREDTTGSGAYHEGVGLLREGRYGEAIEILRPYGDLNTAINYLALGYDLMALRTLEGLSRTSDNLYLRAIAHSRLGDEREAVRCFRESTGKDPSKRWRGNLDPEISSLIRKYGLDNE